MAKTSIDHLLCIERPATCFVQGHDCLQLCGQATLPFTLHIPLTTIPKCPSNTLIEVQIFTPPRIFQSLVAMYSPIYYAFSMNYKICYVKRSTSFSLYQWKSDKPIRRYLMTCRSDLCCTRVLFNRGHRGTAKFAIFREKSRNLPFPRKIAILTFYRDKSRFLPFNYNEISYSHVV